MLTATAPATTLSATDRSYLPALTGLRAVAAYLVFLHHFNPFAKAGPTQVLYRALLEFHIGVPIFFVLSGFLITLRYSTTVQWTWSWWGQYLRNRVARIYPLFFLMTCISFAWIYSTEGSFHVRVWLLNVLFLRGFFSELIYSGLSQGWTLTVEECFYLFAPLAFWLRTQGKVRLWLLPFALLALGCALVLLFRPLPLYGLFGNFKFMMLLKLFGRSIDFFAGMQLALWYRRGQLRRYSVPGLLTGLGVLLMGATVAGMVLVKGSYDYGQESPFGVMLNNVVLPGAIMLLFAGLLTEPTGFRRFLSTPLLQLLGKSSYAFYLVHVGFFQELLRDHLATGNGMADLLLAFVVLNALALALYYLVEQPLNQFIRRLGGRRPLPALS